VTLFAQLINNGRDAKCGKREKEGSELLRKWETIYLHAWISSYVSSSHFSLCALISWFISKSKDKHHMLFYKKD